MSLQMQWVLLFAGLTVPAAAQAQVLTGPVINPANGHSYYLLTSATWTASEAQAVTLGGHLATIDSAAENTWVYNSFANFGGVNRNLWIGLYDPDAVNNSTDPAVRRLEFEWVSDSTAAYRNWSPVEPNNPANGDPVTVVERYVHIWNPGDFYAGQWNNYSNTDTLFNVPMHGVVEVVPVPEPVAGMLCVVIASALASGYLICTHQSKAVNRV